MIATKQRVTTTETLTKSGCHGHDNGTESSTTSIHHSCQSTLKLPELMVNACAKGTADTGSAKVVQV